MVLAIYKLHPMCCALECSSESVVLHVVYFFLLFAQPWQLHDSTERLGSFLGLFLFVAISVAAHELVHTSCGIDQLCLSGIERV